MRPVWAGRVRVSALVIFALVMFVPVYWVAIASITPPAALLSKRLSSAVPRQIDFSSYSRVLFESDFPIYFSNSLLVALITTGACLVLSTFAGYALARLGFPGRRFVGDFILLTYIVPPVLLIVPLFSVMASLRLVDTRTGLVITHLCFVLPFSIWMMKGYFAGLPPQLEEAARVDGATRIQAMVHVAFPLAIPGMVATALFSFILSWNEFLFALIFLNSDSVRTLPIGVVSSFSGAVMQPRDWTALMAAAVLSSAPVFLIFLSLQRFLVRGMAAGAMKG